MNDVLIEINALWETKGRDLFDSPNDFTLWLETNNIMLKGEKPLDVLRVYPGGYTKVDAVLGRLLHGIF